MDSIRVWLGDRGERKVKPDSGDLGSLACREIGIQKLEF
jgi:hypothetical protein